MSIEWTRPEDAQFEILQPGGEAEDGNTVSGPDHGLQVLSPEGSGLVMYGQLEDMRRFLQFMIDAVDIEMGNPEPTFEYGMQSRGVMAGVRPVQTRRKALDAAKQFGGVPVVRKAVPWTPITEDQSDGGN